MTEYLDRPHARLAYEIAGRTDDAAPVVVAHSFLASRGLEDQLAVFDWSSLGEASRPLIRFDARGHGESTGDAVAEHYEWPLLAEDLLAVADAAAGPASVLDAIGESTGCGTVLWAATRSPERFRRLVLVIPPTVRDERHEQGQIYLAAAELVELRGAEAWSRLVDTFPPVPLLDRGGWERARHIPVDIGLLPAVLRGAAASDLPDDAALAVLACPTLILTWSGDPNHPVSSAEHLARVLPHAELEVASEPDEVRAWGARVAEFLAR